MREDDLREHIRLGRAAWPEVDLTPSDFLRFVVTHWKSEVPPTERGADLFIAAACANGSSRAAEAFDRSFRSAIERAVARVDPTVVDDAVQTVLVSLLVGDAKTPPRIGSYGGRAALRTWLTTIVKRTTLNMRRRMDDRAHQSLGALANVAVGVAPELELAKMRYGRELQAALGDALASLDPRQIVLLRLHHTKGLSVDRLAEIYSIGRSTAARWVASARIALVEETKRRMNERVPMTPSELESVIHVLQSNLDVSLLRLLSDERAST